MPVGVIEVKRELIDWYDERQTTFAGVDVSPILNDDVVLPHRSKLPIQTEMWMHEPPTVD